MSTNQNKLLTDGTVAQGVVLLDSGGNVLNIESTRWPGVLQQDLIGHQGNYYPTRELLYSFGKCSAVQNVLRDTWDGPTDIYVFPDIPQQMRLVSTSANDSASGSGVQQVFIRYLDANYIERSEIVTLNGTTPVLTVATDIIRVNRLRSQRLGTIGGYSAGDISLTNTAATITFAILPAFANVSRQLIYTIPGDRIGYINHWQASSGSTGNHFTQMTLLATCHDGISVPNVFLVQDEQGSQNGGQVARFDIPIRIPSRTDIKVGVRSDASNANVIALTGIMGWTEPI